MKKLLLLFTLLWAFIAKAQHAYIPMQMDSSLWVVVMKDWHEDVPGTPPTFDYVIDWFPGIDTVMPNGKKYYPQLTTQNSPSPIPNGSLNYMRTGLYREDTIAKKVWKIRDIMFPNWEQVVYDFSLHVGDTITDTQYLYLGPQSWAKVWVDAIDSVYWIDGTWRYRWLLATHVNGLTGLIGYTYMIEGMGYVNRFFGDPFNDYIGPHILTWYISCYKTKDQWLYEQPNPWGANCDTMITKDVVPVGINTIENDLSLPILYPNPITSGDFIHFNYYSANRNKDYFLLAYDINGKHVLQRSCKPGDDILIELPPGLYLFRVIDVNRISFAQQTILIK